MSTVEAPLGGLLKDWRQRRRMSQLDLALEAGVSARHLSFLETGRSKPSRDMVIHLSEQLDVPLRQVFIEMVIMEVNADRDGTFGLSFHGVDRIYPSTSALLKNGGRINLTLRRVTKAG